LITPPSARRRDESDASYENVNVLTDGWISALHENSIASFLSQRRRSRSFQGSWKNHTIEQLI
jgi:hypothetical protein